MKITKTKHEEYIKYTNELNQLHREDGPAVELFDDGRKYWFYNGEYISCKTQEEFE